MTAQSRAVGAQLDLLWIDVLELLSRVGHVLRNIHDHRTWTTGLRQIEGFLQDFWDLRSVLDHKAVLHDRPGDTDHVGFLESISTDHGAWHLTGQHHHRNGIHIGSGNTGDGIGCARTRGYQHHTGFTGGAGIAVGHMSSRLLVTNQDVLHFRFFEQGIVDV